MGAFFNFCKFACVFSSFVYISYYIESRKKKLLKTPPKALDVIPQVNSLKTSDRLEHRLIYKIFQFSCFEDSHKYFLSELHTGGIMIERNDFQNGVKHLANAIFVCNKPLELMTMLKSSMPIDAYNLVLQRLEEMHFEKPPMPSSFSLSESFDDLE